MLLKPGALELMFRRTDFLYFLTLTCILPTFLKYAAAQPVTFISTFDCNLPKQNDFKRPLRRHQLSSLMAGKNKRFLKVFLCVKIKTVAINMKLCMVYHWKLQMCKLIKLEWEKQVRYIRKEVQIVKSYKIIESELSDFPRRINMVGLKGNEVILLKTNV